MDMSFMDTALVPVIVGICAIVGLLVKQTVPSDRFHDFIPTIVCVLGAAMALASQGISLESLFAGMASGLASTGCWEMITHWTKKEE